MKKTTVNRIALLVLTALCLAALSPAGHQYHPRGIRGSRQYGKMVCRHGIHNRLEQRYQVKARPNAVRTKSARRNNYCSSQNAVHRNGVDATLPYPRDG